MFYDSKKEPVVRSVKLCRSSCPAACSQLLHETLSGRVGFTSTSERVGGSHSLMFNPKNPLQAALIFTAGIGIVGLTILDIHRVTKQNEQPMTEEQIEALQEFGNEARRRAAGMSPP